MEKENDMLDVIKEIALAKKDARKACNQIAYYEFEQDVKKLTDKLVDLYEGNLALYQKLLKEMRELEDEDFDFEHSHIVADGLLTSFIRELGFAELADSYDRVGKWYS